MALPFAFQSLPAAFDVKDSGAVNVTFQRWQGNYDVVMGTAVDGGFAPLVLSPKFYYGTRVPKDVMQQNLPGNQRLSACLVWSITSDFFSGATYPALRTVLTPEGVPDSKRADRIIDNDTGFTYIVATELNYGRQSGISGAIGLRFQG